jgi:hypothetical protein
MQEKSEKKIEKENSISDENKSPNDETTQNYFAEWSDQHEIILVEWADKAICYRWLHSTSHSNYAFKNRWFTVPVIIMSTLTGTANFAQERVPESYQPMFQLVVGSVNILAGIITTIQQFLKISELNEAHRVSSISWDKFYRNIKLELAKSRLERMPAYQMLKISKEEFDRLMETSPSIDKKVVNKFTKIFSGGTIKIGKELNSKQQIFNDLYKPEICDVLESTKNSLYKETEKDIAKKSTKKLVTFVKENSEFRRKSLHVEKFLNNFNNEYKREPTLDEIHDNLKDEVTNDIIDVVVNRNNEL